MADPSAQQAADEELLSDRYRLGEPLGEGAMGEVYRAEHVMMEKTVAIKVLRREMSENDEIVSRFQREARAAANLTHPNVCQATDFGQTDDGSFFLVMEYLEGDTLEARIEEEAPLCEERALHIARQIAGALMEAHKAGIVHRDLKPENAMLVDRHGDADTVKIMDFGIAHLVASAKEDEDAPARLTREGMVYGTPHYMSPEQVAGEDVDARTDLYALGVVLFEMLTGTAPYDGDNIARVMGKHITEPIPAIDDHLDGSAPSAVQELVETLMAKAPEDRPESAREAIELIDETEQHLEDGEGAFTERMEQLTTRAKESGRQAVDELGPRLSRAADNVGPHAETAAKKAGVAARKIGEFAGWAIREVVDLWTDLPKFERRIAAGLTAAFLMVLVFVVAALTFVFSADRQAEAIDDSQQARLETEEIAEALSEARRGDRQPLDRLMEEHPDDAHLRFLALEADLEANRSVNLVEAAREILDRDRRYAHEPELIDRLVDELGDGDVDELLMEYMSSTIRDLLAEQASVGSRSSTRDRAYEFLQDSGEYDNLQRWQQLTAEMRQTWQCSELEEMLDELVAIGEPGAVPTLEALQSISRRNCGTLNLRDCLRCIRGDLPEAIEILSE